MKKGKKFIVALKDVGELKSGGTPNKSKKNYWGGNYPWVTAKDLKSPVLFGSIDQLTEEGFSCAKVASVNSLLILVRGMTLFKDVPVCLAGCDMAFNQDIKALTIKDGVYPKYLLFYLISNKNILLRYVDSAGHGTGRMNIDLLKELPILLPPLPEQRGIADLLSTWDKAIEKTEQLIQTKEKRFRWLSGNLIYVPTKKGIWKQALTKSLFKERKENNRCDLPLLSITNGDGVIPREETNRKDTSNKDKSKYLRICPGDIGYNTMRMWQGVSALSSLEGIVSPAYTICIPGEKLCPLFVAYLFKMPFMIHRFYRYSQGLTSDTWNLKFPHFSEVKMPIPSIEEQEQIAETLLSARREIDLLKQLADKYKTQKRGLMQKLLTGEWRIKPEIITQYMED